MSSPRCLAFTTTHGMINRVHGDTTHPRPTPQPSPPTRLSQGDVFVALVAHLTDRGLTLRQDHVYLTGRQFDVGISPFLGHQLGKASRAPHQLSTSPRSKLDVVDLGACGNIAKRQHVTGGNIRFLTRHHRIAHDDLVGRNDVAFFSISIMQQGDTGGPIRVILDTRYPCGNVHLVTFEIDQAISLFMPTTAMPACDATIGVSPALLEQRSKKTSFWPFCRKILEGIIRLKPSSRRCRFRCSDCHISIPAGQAVPGPLFLSLPVGNP